MPVFALAIVRAVILGAVFLLLKAGVDKGLLPGWSFFVGIALTAILLRRYLGRAARGV